ncbi:MAG: type II toxin-antitoxin system PemK/MazF family toxin [Opitutaceae bacterium]
MKRGEIFSVSAPGDFGKPRPAVIVQTDALNQRDFASVIICPFTGTVREAPLFRILVNPTPENGLSKPSQIMVDKVQAVALKRIGQRIGSITDEQTLQLNRTLAFVVGIG